MHDPPQESSLNVNGSQHHHSIILVCGVLCRANGDFNARRFPLIANLNDRETHTRRIKFATGSISFETNFISSGMNSIYFEITCNIYAKGVVAVFKELVVLLKRLKHER